MISGGHVILYSRDADGDRAFLRDVLGLDHVDAGGGWLIFRLPPSEVAVHPTDGEAVHEFYLQCDDIAETLRDLAALGVESTPVTEQPWGILSTITLPSGAPLGIYEPKHPLP